MSGKTNILIIEEDHPSTVFYTAALQCLFLTELKEAGVKTSEIKPIADRLCELFDLIIGICKDEMDYLEKYADYKIFVEKILTGKSEQEDLKDAKQLFSTMDLSCFGSAFNRKLNELFNVLEVYEKKLDVADFLEIKILSKAISSLGLGNVYTLREFPTGLKLVRIAKESARSGKKVLIICGKPHGGKYAKALKLFGYDIKKISLPKAEIRLLKLLVTSEVGIRGLIQTHGLDLDELKRKIYVRLKKDFLS